MMLCAWRVPPRDRQGSLWSLSSGMGLSTRASHSTVNVMAMEGRLSPMDHSMRAIGNKIDPMAKVSFCKPMGAGTRVNFSMIYVMGGVGMSPLTVHWFMRVTLRMISLMAMALKSNRTSISMLGTSKMDVGRALAPCNGVMVGSMKGSGKMGFFMDLELLLPPIFSTKATGKKENPIYKEHTHGKMAGAIKVDTIWVKNKALALISSKMKKYIKESGKMENNMEKEKLYIQMEPFKKVNGSMGKKYHDTIFFSLFFFLCPLNNNFYQIP